MLLQLLPLPLPLLLLLLLVFQAPLALARPAWHEA
jgi:hypothetical protein